MDFLIIAAVAIAMFLGISYVVERTEVAEQRAKNWWED